MAPDGSASSTKGWYSLSTSLQRNELEAEIQESHKTGGSLTHFPQFVFEVKNCSSLENLSLNGTVFLVLFQNRDLI